MIIEKKRRTVVKALSWRFCGTVATMLLVYVFTRELVLSIGVGLVEGVGKLVLYYVHERVWGRVKWGRISLD